MEKTTPSTEDNYTTDFPRKLPKVLIVGQPFNSETGGGITLSNLFRGWDQDRLAVVCSTHLINGNTNVEACKNYYQLGQKELKWIFPFSVLKRKHYSGPIKLEEKRLPFKAPASSLRSKLIMDYLYPTLEFVGLYNYASSVRLSPELRKWLDDFQPDVVYAQATSRAGVSFCRMIQNYLKKPFIFHMMDDWPSMLKEQGPFGNYWYRTVNNELKNLFDQSDLLMSVSDSMATEYNMRYGKQSVVFHNPIDIDFWKKDRRTTFDLHKAPSLLYAGRVGTGIDTSLETIAQAIKQTNEELGTSLSFVLQTAEKPSWADKYGCVKHKAFVPYDELPKAFATADFLILPYDFSEKSIKFIGHSMPTKAPEYMASGTPIIVFSPEETALVQYVKKYNCAEVVTENNVDLLQEAIKKLMVDQNLRTSLSLRAVEIADHNHNALEVTNSFKNLICSLQRT